LKLTLSMEGKISVDPYNCSQARRTSGSLRLATSAG
jgi:hypothetical protein